MCELRGSARGPAGARAAPGPRRAAATALVLRSRRGVSLGPGGAWLRTRHMRAAAGRHGDRAALSSCRACAIDYTCFSIFNPRESVTSREWAPHSLSSDVSLACTVARSVGWAMAEWRGALPSRALSSSAAPRHGQLPQQIHRAIFALTTSACATQIPCTIPNTQRAILIGSTIGS